MRDFLFSKPERPQEAQHYLVTLPRGPVLVVCFFVLPEAGFVDISHGWRGSRPQKRGSRELAWTSLQEAVGFVSPFLSECAFWNRIFIIIAVIFIKEEISLVQARKATSLYDRAIKLTGSFKNAL